LLAKPRDKEEDSKTKVLLSSRSTAVFPPLKQEKSQIKTVRARSTLRPEAILDNDYYFNLPGEALPMMDSAYKSVRSTPSERSQPATEVKLASSEGSPPRVA